METIKVLGQNAPLANTLTDLYTVPATKSAVLSSIIICNQNGTDITFRVSIAVAGASDTAKQYIYYDLPLLNNDTFVVTIGISLATGDVIRVRSSNPNVSFTVMGVEVS